MQNAFSVENKQLGRYNESSNDLNKVIGEMSLLLMLNQVCEAKKVCMHAIEKIRRNREFEERMTDLLEIDK